MKEGTMSTATSTTLTPALSTGCTSEIRPFKDIIQQAKMS